MPSSTGMALAGQDEGRGAVVRSMAALTACAVSLASAGRMTSRFGMARMAASCSTGWWVGPSWPRPTESWVQE